MAVDQSPPIVIEGVHDVIESLPVQPPESLRLEDYQATRALLDAISEPEEQESPTQRWILAVAAVGVLVAAIIVVWMLGANVFKTMISG